MNVILPDFKGQEKSTLYFIGNGFDLYHGMKTQYKDFREWLKKYKYIDFVNIMESLFPEINKDGDLLLWKDFESSLGFANIQNAHDTFFQGTDNGFYDEDVQNRVHNRIEPHLKKIPSVLQEWLLSIPTNNISKSLNLSKDSWYLSFNYTLLLENVYYIPSNHIFHIHNSINDDYPLITGHDYFYDEDGINTDNINIEKSTQQIAKDLNCLRKPVDNIIKQNRVFFDSLKYINHVVVFGHSLSMIDRPYFNEVLENVKDGTKWYFVIKDKDNTEIEKLVRDYNDCIRKRYNGWVYENKMTIDNCHYLYCE